MAGFGYWGGGLQPPIIAAHACHIEMNPGQLLHVGQTEPRIMLSPVLIQLVVPLQVLNGSFSLELVSEKYWKVNKPMELYFAPTKEHK